VPALDGLILNTESTYDWVDHDWSVPINFLVTKLITESLGSARKSDDSWELGVAGHKDICPIDARVPLAQPQ
jgi:hypothetical protein